MTKTFSLAVCSSICLKLIFDVFFLTRIFRCCGTGIATIIVINVYILGVADVAICGFLFFNEFVV